MTTRSWELRKGNTPLGVLSLVEIDQPWFRCVFTPGEGWEKVGHLFEAQAEAVDSGDQHGMMQAIGAVRGLALELRSQETDETIIPIMLQIRGDRANFRY
ncbi:hypothetical protein ACFYRD_34475 [Streptomyces hirsutus]|uniref:hypothetical protein n=1 Tax=Streptomyces hirsutus TaxID=35620 RepID=UPI003683B51D